MTGNDIYRGCELLVHPPASPPPARDILVQGYCAGAVTAVVATNLPPGASIDGEAVVLGPDGSSRFEALSRRETASPSVNFLRRP